jgi:hypothetical protein
MKLQTTYTYAAVRHLLCDLCKYGIPDYLVSTAGPDRIYKHTFNGTDSVCQASMFRIKAWEEEDRQDLDHP